MKRLTTLSLIAVAAAAMIAVPVDAQTRSGSNSRGGSGGGNARNNGGTRPSSSMSAPASQNRSAGQSGNTKGLGSVNRSSQPAHTTSSQPQRTAPQQPPKASSQPKAPSQPKAQPQQPPKEQPRAQSQPPRSGSNQPARSGSNVRKQEQLRDEPRRNEPRVESRQRPNQPGGSINRNQPQPGMSVKPDAPRTVRERPGAPRNFEGGREPNHIKMRPGPGHNMERIPPRHRDPMPYGRAVRFWDGGHHYFGYRVSYLPARRTRVVYAGVPYYLLDGIYYRYYRGYYYVSRPPFGIVVDAILDNIIYAACNFAYYYDVANTYRTINENAKTIATQNATIAANNATIARQNADIALNTERAAQSYKEADRLGLVQSYADAGVEYFYQDGVFFTKDKNGKYVTIVPPAGALVGELPDDYDTITLDGEEYYKVDDTVYKLTIIDGSPYFEVLGQLTGSLAQKYDLYDSL
ncbi:MAG: hypothetical protein K6A62_03245 [Bacteroidales bacterium]|nr:hypothetical protein [Bacteroidales bacterium]